MGQSNLLNTKQQNGHEEKNEKTQPETVEYSIKAGQKL